MEKQKVHMVSLGCPKNLVDSEIMLGSLTKFGYDLCQNSEDADVIVVNTCSFIEEARKESVDTILDFSETHAGKKLVVTGCLPQRYKEQLVSELPEVDIFIGTGEFQNIGKILSSANPKKSYFGERTFLQADDTTRINSQPWFRAYLKISEGCLKRCAFCAIPKIRGNLQSRTLNGVINEAKLLRAGGVRELNIISHDFTDYGWDLRKASDSNKESPFELLRSLSEIDFDWIRLLYLYPDGITPEMIKLMKEKNNLVKYFDMPLQHISDSQLKKMNRKMNSEDVKEAIELIQGEIPEAVIRTQFIVGFPWETEKDFEELLNFVETRRFDRVGCFMYSPEENTAAGKMTDQISEDVKLRRHNELMTLQNSISTEKLKASVGKVLDVLIEGVSEESDLLLQGRTSQQAHEIDGVTWINEGRAEVGEIVKVEIVDSTDYDLVGRILDAQQ